jgi:hypothetical protein
LVASEMRLLAAGLSLRFLIAGLAAPTFGAGTAAVAAFRYADHRLR